jgi:hypothetical protein
MKSDVCVCMCIFFLLSFHHILYIVVRCRYLLSFLVTVVHVQNDTCEHMTQSFSLLLLLLIKNYDIEININVKKDPKRNKNVQLSNETKKHGLMLNLPF